jgi:DeoR/GlpR family transcriptional regulator of sugar metabolism
VAKQRRDADRRVRQCERFARLIRIAQLLLGHGRWGPDDLAKEICCSVRTIYRDITTLSMAGIPIHFDKGCNAYRVLDNYRFPGIESRRSNPAKEPLHQLELLPLVRSFIEDGERLIDHLKSMCEKIEADPR